jgi:prepilin-type N-terminal cleavage/methylation domain-containing protein/prepilin-type processing-associated H-X9-DG protein
MNHKRGFTLIELLVVISIIALLLSILMPALSKVKEQARIVVCKSNLKQLSVAIDTYRVDYNGKAPISLGGRSMWMFQLAPYMGESKYVDDPTKVLEGAMKVLWCPSTREPPGPPDVGTFGRNDRRWRYHWADPVSGIFFGAEGSYVLNEYIGGIDFNLYGEDWATWPELDPENANPRSFRVSGTGRSDVPVFGDGVWMGGYPRVGDLTSGSWCYRTDGSEPLVYGGVDNGVSRFYIDRHDMANNFSFADGHVEKVDLMDYWKLKWNAIFRVQKSDVIFP